MSSEKILESKSVKNVFENCFSKKEISIIAKNVDINSVFYNLKKIINFAEYGIGNKGILCLNIYIYIYLRFI